MPRFEWGPTIGAVNLVESDPAAPAPAPVPAPADPATPKADVEVAFAGVTPAGVFSFELPAYDPATHHVLSAMHIVLVADGTPTPADPAAAVAAGSTLPHYRTDCSTLLTGGTVAVDATDAIAGSYNALAIREFAE